MREADVWRLKSLANSDSAEVGEMFDHSLLTVVIGQFRKSDEAAALATQLLDRYKTLADLTSTSAETLIQSFGLSETEANSIILIRQLAERMLRCSIPSDRKFKCSKDVLNYLKVSQALQSREQLRVLFLDRRDRLIKDELIQQGTVDHLPVYVREIMKRALELSASGLILVHNHPSGDANPSRADIEMTKQVMEAGRALGIVVHDHIIVARSGHQSMRDLELL